MDTSTWVAVYLPLFVLFIIILPQQNRIQNYIKIMKRRKGLKTMTNEMIKKFIGRNCRLSTGPYGSSIVGKIADVNENWIEVETKKGSELVNADFVHSIKTV